MTTTKQTKRSTAPATMMPKTPTTPAPLEIRLTAADQQRFASLAAEEQQIRARRNEAVTIIIGHAGHNPASLAGWSIDLSDTAITCTPPAEPKTA